MLAVLALLNAFPSLAHASDRAGLELQLDPATPGTPAQALLEITHSNTEDPEGKPPVVTRNVIELPEGIAIDVEGFPQCTASDLELRIHGRYACPIETRVGGGEIVAVTGLGLFVDPFPTDVAIFNGPGHLIELVQMPNTNLTIAVDRAPIEGNTLTAVPPATPGGPPDFKTALQRLTFRIGLPGPGGEILPYITTPPECPSSGAWTTHGTFTYSDGIVSEATALTECSTP